MLSLAALRRLKLRKGKPSRRRLVFENLERRAMFSITSTTPAVGEAFQLSGPLTYDVQFSEPINPATVQTADLVVSGIPGAIVSKISVLPGNSIVRSTISGVTQEGTLSASIAARAVLDALNQPEPAFSANYPVDFGTLSLPNAPAAKPPFGSLIYDSTMVGTIAPATDQDRFTVSIDPNQRVSIAVMPTGNTLQPVVTLLDSSNHVIATNAAVSAGNAALLQSVSSSGTASELYTVQIEGAAGSTGGYSFRIALNAALEDESLIPGVSNDTIAAAQNIDSSTVSPSSTSTRLGLLGTISSATDQDNFQFSMSAGETATLAAIGLGGANVNLELRDSGGTLLASGIVGGAGQPPLINNFLATATGNYYLRVVASGVAPYSLVIARNSVLEVESNDASSRSQDITGATSVLGSITNGVTQSLFATDTGFWDENGNHNPADKSYIAGVSGGIEKTPYFIFNLGNVSQPITAARLQLYNPPNGYVSADSSESISVYNPYLDSVSTLMGTSAFGTSIYYFLSSGAFYATATVSAASDGKFIPISLGSFAPSDLNAKRGSQFALSANITSISGTSDQYIFGNSSTTGSANQLVLTLADTADWYSLNIANTSNPISISSTTFGDGPGQFSNPLNPHIELYDPSGKLVATGVPLPDGRNESIQFQPNVSGVYKIRVTGEGNTNGDYLLSLASNRTTPAFQISSADIAEGSRFRVVPNSITLDFSDSLLLTSLSPADIKIDGVSASSLSVIDGNTVKFSFPTPLVDGTHVVTIAADALVDLAGNGLIAFTRSFVVDTTPPRVISTSIIPGGAISPGEFTYQITFSEPMLASNIVGSGVDFILHLNVANATMSMLGGSR